MRNQAKAATATAEKKNHERQKAKELLLERQDSLGCIVQINRMPKIEQQCRTAYARRIARIAKSNPKGEYEFVKSKINLRKYHWRSENRQEIKSPSRQAKFDSLPEFIR